jgi:lipopolysaccharide/colanic/teichoic acid biosynthesis glycosyltransferase
MSSLKSLAFDLLLVALATIAAAITRDNFEIIYPRLINLVPYLIITLGIAGVVLPALGIHRSAWQFTTMQDCLRVVAATVMVILSAVAVDFLVNRLDSIARALPLIQALLIVAFLVGARILKRASHDRRRVRLAPTPSDRIEIVLVMGLNKLTEFYFQCISEFHSDHVRIAGVLGAGGRVGRSVQSHPVLGEPEQVVSTLRRLETHGVFVDCILVTTPRNDLSLAVQIALSQIQETTTIRLEYLAERMGIQSPPRTIVANPAPGEPIGSTAGVVNRALGQVSYHQAKRVIDAAASAAMLISLAPLFLLVGLLVAADVGLPFVFWQQRPGLRGRPFKLFKFRTMGAAHHADGQRISDGERVSAVGNFLRRTRLDELPQLFNILKGDMSFVGPRPLLPIDQPADCVERLAVRPGLTGWAQIKGGRQIPPSDKAVLDMWYVRNISLALDAEIILGTVPMLILGERVADSAIGQAWQDLKIAGPPNRVVQQEIGSRTL